MISRRALTHRSARPNRTLSLAVATVGVVGVLTACGGSDDDADTDANSDTTPAPQVEEASTESDPVVDAPASGDGSGTLTTSDGATYGFAMTTCETSENGASGFLIEDGFDLFGKTADGAFSMQFIRAGADDYVVETGALEGDFDENGQNAGIIYIKVVDTLAFTVDGGDVSGTVTLTPIGPNRPHGDEVGATVDVSC